MWNEPSEERLSQIPRLYETEHTPVEDKEIHLHFFLMGCDWYIAEYDGNDLFFGYAILNNDYSNAEWGYISFSELKAIRFQYLEVDCELEDFWHIRPVKEIAKIGKKV